MYDVRDGLAADDIRCMYQDREGYLWFGTNSGVSRFDGQDFVNYSTSEGLVANQIVAIAEDRSGHLWFATDGGVSRFDGAEFANYTENDRYLGFGRKDPLASNDVHCIFRDRDDRLWFGTQGGVSRFSDDEFTTFTTEYGLAGDRVLSILQDHKGHMWLGTGNGISRYDGQLFRNYATKSKLAKSDVHSILEDRTGQLWFGTEEGVSRFDGEEFTSFPLGERGVISVLEDRHGVLWFGTEDGVIYRYDGRIWENFTALEEGGGQGVAAIFEDRLGDLWFGYRSSGVCRYDGRKWTIYPTGWLRESAQQIMQDQDGSLWFGTHDGAYRYNGYAWTTFTTADGLADNDVKAIGADELGRLWCETAQGFSRYDGEMWWTLTPEEGLADTRVVPGFADRSGHPWQALGSGGPTPESVVSGAEDQQGGIWLATAAGLSRYNGEEWRIFTTRDGLAHNRVESVFADRSGHMWFGTQRSGVSRFDGRVFQTLTPEDGLAGGGVRGVYQDGEGQYWFATDQGISRFCPPEAVPPAIFLDGVMADRRYRQTDKVSLPSNLGLVAFEFHAVSLKTRPGAMIFRYRLRGFEDDWSTTRKRSVRYDDLPEGEYTFEVTAVDRDLVYSDPPAVVELRIHSPRERIQWMAALGVVLALCAWQTVRVFQKDRQQRQGVEDGFHAARDMQMALMPEERCDFEGFEVMGRCLPAREIGGNLYAFFRRRSRLVVALAAVEGRGLPAAVALRTLHGILRNEMLHNNPIEEVPALLEEVLPSTVDGPVGLVLGELDPASRVFRLVNAGCPSPCLFQAATGQTIEVKQRAQPLGAGGQGAYPLVDLTLEPGDRVAFYSSGVIETRNLDGEELGASRLLEAFGRGCVGGLSVEYLLRSLFGEIAGFSRGGPQEDDRTIVAMKSPAGAPIGSER
ncbi:MAG: SpoIIE family protein phosphatase [Gemmatimonadetes bacterium]|nr:SpoIIE family protein phosphatase [Gemmatimonadota bacterium]